MTSRRLKVLICEDDVVDSELCVGELRRAGFEPYHERVETEEEYRAALERGGWSIVLSDYSMPRFSALDALRILRATGAELPFIVVTGSIDEETAVACLREGANDYVLKENVARIAPAVESAIDVFAERRRSRQLERELFQSQKLEAVGRLAAGVAHDFNNMLTVIRSCTEHILDATQDPDLCDAAGKIVGAAARASDLTRRLLGFGRGQMSSPEVVELRALVRELEGLLGPSFGERVDVEILAEGERRVWVDPGLIEQVIMNLAINASDAMPAGGRLSISTADRDVGEAQAAALEIPPGAYASVVVEDTGTGIAAADQDRVFEPFFTTKSAARGSGLGLSTAYGVLRRSGGAIHFESEVGKGTKFEILLPATERKAAEDPGAGRAAVGRRPSLLGGRVLLVDDDPLVRSVVASALTRHGLEPVEAESSAAALEVFDRDRDGFDLVLCDLVMPDVSGAELRRRFAEVRPALPFVMISGYADAGDNELEGLENVSFLAKPFGSAGLIEAIGQAMQRPAD